MPQTVYSKTITASADGAFQLDSEERTWLKSLNIHCYTNDAYYGNAAVQPGILRANSVIWFESPVKISDIWFKNYTAGSNCVISVVGILKE